MLHFDAREYWLTQFHGDWAEEAQQQESRLTSGIKVIAVSYTHLTLPTN